MAENSIQRTFNISDALNERIKIIEEDISKTKTDLDNINNRNAIVKTKRIVFLILMIIPIVIASFTMLAIMFEPEGSGPAFVILVCFPAMCAYIFWTKRKKYIVDIEAVGRLESRIAALGKELNKAKDEKREIVIRYERELKLQEESDIIDDSFTIEVDSKECPMCAETVKAKAKVCRFCSHKFEQIQI
jgi:uncharacterized small protein (DUF1192 family)